VVPTSSWIGVRWACILSASRMQRGVDLPLTIMRHKQCALTIVCAFPRRIVQRCQPA
jgi:hypothetical protein